MIKLGKNSENDLIKLFESKNIGLEGNIIKLFESDNDVFKNCRVEATERVLFE